jgi:hypothetical protein
MLLRKIFGTKREEFSRDWKILRTELHYTYCSPNTMGQFQFIILKIL